MSDVPHGILVSFLTPRFVAKVFEGRHLAALYQSGFSDFRHREVTVAAFFDTAFVRLRKSYRCEYVFKNEIVRKLFLARHDPRISIVIPEFSIRGNRIDLVIVNGTTTAYEIKTAYDSLDRLTAQVEASLQVFDRVIIVCDPRNVATVRALAVDDRVGILCYTKNGTFRPERQWRTNAARVDPRAIFDCLRATEYLPALRQLLGLLPTVPNTMTYRTFAPAFASLRPEIAHRVLAKALRKRFADRSSAALTKALPVSMAQLYYETRRSDRARLFSESFFDRHLFSDGHV